MKRGEDMPMTRSRLCGGAGLQARALVLALAALWLAPAGRAAAVCAGDCNGDGRVSIAEVQNCVNLGAGLQAPACAAADADGSGGVDANDVDACVASFLDPATCQMAATPVPTNTVAATNTVAPTNTTVPTATRTNTVAPTATNTSAPTPTRTNTAQPTATNTPVPLGKQVCELTGAPDSTLLLQTQAFPLPPFGATGEIEIDCGAPGSDGAAACTCGVKSFGTVVIPGIGDICVNPFPGCTPGRFDCDGGSGVDVDLKTNHNIGSCTSNAQCLTACEARCDSLGATYSRLLYGCEGFCQGGSNDEASCLRDSECPGGQCVGAEPVSHIGTCNCSCGGSDLGAAAPAGSLTCNIGTQIDVELPSDNDCLDANTIVLAGVCGGVSTATSTGQILNVNNNNNVNTPPQPRVMTGAGISCANYAAGNIGGLKMVGQLGFFDSTLGDILSQNTFTCSP
jgi:hypothetical protein